MRLLVTDGTVTADIVPYDAERISSNITDAASYHISNYLHIFNKDKRNSLKVFEVQKALMRGNPVIVEMNVPGE